MNKTLVHCCELPYVKKSHASVVFATYPSELYHVIISKQGILQSQIDLTDYHKSEIKSIRVIDDSLIVMS